MQVFFYNRVTFSADLLLYDSDTITKSKKQAEIIGGKIL
jgi:hypothetical protein